MAVVTTDGNQLVVSLSGWERLPAFRGDVRVPLAAVRSVTVEAQPWNALRGVRAPGTGIPGVIAYGVRRLTRDRPDFAAVHGHRPALRVELDPPSPFAQLLVTVSDAQASSIWLRRAAAL